MSKTTFTILLGGDLRVTDRLCSIVDGSRVIAADGGMAHAVALGLVPELWVGDFDSTKNDLYDLFPDVPRQSYPAAKAASDCEIAVDTAMERGAKRLILAGALGGARSDHALQNLMYGMSLAQRGLDVVLTSGEEEATPLLPGEMTLDLPLNSLFSVVGLSELRGLSITHARYPLCDFTLSFGGSRTLSNVAQGSVAFSLVDGQAMILCRPYDFSGV